MFASTAATSPHRDTNTALYDARNYLIRGGNRALVKETEDKLVRLSEAAIKVWRRPGCLCIYPVYCRKRASDILH